MDRRLFLTALAGGITVAAQPASAQLFGAPEPDLWPRWTRHDPGSQAGVDHTPWDAFLGRYLSMHPDGIARLNYAAAADGRSALDDYVGRLAATRVSFLNRAEQFAYWVNLYNAATVQVILDHYPVASIRDIDISPGLFSNGPWGAQVTEVEGEALTLDDIEHRILRPIWGDPRIHYAVNCAALGCPNLQSVAFTAANTESLLEAGARTYVNHPRGARVDGGDLIVSSIYIWFDEDFGSSDAGVIAHLQRYATGALASDLAAATAIDDHAYDWALNEARQSL